MNTLPKVLRPYAVAIGQKVHDIRTSRGISCNVDVKWINQLENGRQVTTGVMLERLAAGLDVDYQVLQQVFDDLLAAESERAK